MSEITIEGYDNLKRELANAETGKAKLEGEKEVKESQLKELIVTLATALGVDPKLITREFLVEKKEAIEAKVAEMKATLGEV